MSRRAFLNASQASQTLAPQGVLSKLGETINARFRNVTSSAGAAAPAPLEGSGGVPAIAARDGAQDAPSAARVLSLSPEHLANLVGGIRKGRGRRTSATSSSSPSSSSPPLSERAVKGVLGSVFTSKETAQEGGVQASAAKRAGPVDGDSVAAPSAAKKTGEVHDEEKSSVGARATTASDGNSRRGGLLGRFGRLNQGSGRTKSSPSLTTPSPANESRQDNNASSGDKMSRERRGVPAAGVAAGVAAAVAARTSTPVVATTAAPSARAKVDQLLQPATTPGSATDAPGKPTEQGGVLRTTKKAVRPESRRRRRSSHEAEEGRHWPDVDVAVGSSTKDSSNYLIGKIRAPWANLKVGGRDPRGEQGGSDRKVETDGADRNAGKAVVIRTNGWFGGRHRMGGLGSESIGNVSDALDEIGLGG